MIHAVPRPTEDYYCQDTSGWQNSWVLNPYNKKCYLFGRNDPETGANLWVNFTEAADFCNKQNKNGGSQLVIADETEFAWVLPRMYGDSWLDMRMASPGVPPKQWNDGTPVSFTNWKDGCPYRND